MEKSDTFFDIPMIEKKIIEDSRAPTTPRIEGATDTLFLPPSAGPCGATRGSVLDEEHPNCIGQRP
jgi:hypothetical protein